MSRKWIDSALLGTGVSSWTGAQAEKNRESFYSLDFLFQFGLGLLLFPFDFPQIFFSFWLMRAVALWRSWGSTNSLNSCRFHPTELREMDSDHLAVDWRSSGSSAA